MKGLWQLVVYSEAAVFVVGLYPRLRTALPRQACFSALQLLRHQQLSSAWMAWSKHSGNGSCRHMDELQGTQPRQRHTWTQNLVLCTPWSVAGAACPDEWSVHLECRSLVELPARLAQNEKSCSSHHGMLQPGSTRKETKQGL